MSKQTIINADWKDAVALVRVDFNVPMERGTNKISDDIRIRASLPTINYLREQGAAVIVCTHLGRPGGKPNKEFELGPIAERLSELLNAPVKYIHDGIGPEAQKAAEELQPGDVLLLENLRFYPGEEANDPEFAKGLAALADAYVNDAFGTAHRAHASTEGVAHHLPAFAGFLLEKEIVMLGSVLDNPKRPLGVLMGGAKVSDKIAVLERLLSNADALFVGGGMAATFLKALGHSVGASLLEQDKVQFCSDVIRRAQQKRISLYLPTDVVIAEKLEKGTPSQVVPVDQIPNGWMVLDIGPQTIDAFTSGLQAMKTIVWNGPMGVFEIPPFDQGTVAIANTLAGLKDKGVVTIIGGGSTAEAVDHLQLGDKMTHVSTGGGASLEFLEGKELPGVAVIGERSTMVK